MTTYSVGSIVKGRVTGIEKYGIFINIDKEYDGLIHISEISDGFVRNITDYVTINDIIYVKIIEVDEENKKLKLSIKGIDYKNNSKPILVDDENGFEPLKERLDSWILDKLKEIKEQSK